MLANQFAEPYTVGALTFSFLRTLADQLRRIGNRVKKMQYTTKFRIKRDKVVSDADLYAQRAITACIKRHVPHAVVVGEEDFETMPKMRRLHLVFIVDPIDGTRYYLSGKDEWAMSVGVYEYGELKGAIVLQPACGESFVACSGHGVEWRKGKRAWQKHVRRRAPLPLTGVSTSVSVAENTRNWGYARALTREFRGACSAPTVAAFLEVLRGRSDACILLYEPKIWDIAAILLLAQEGGILVDICNRSFSCSRKVSRKLSGIPARLVFAANKAKLIEMRFLVPS